MLMPEEIGLAIIERVAPEIDGGRFAIKRVIGETVAVEANVFTHGHDLVAAALLYRPERSGEWCEAPMEALGNDRWSGAFTVTEQGCWRYFLQAWVDRYGTWAHDLGKRVNAGQDVTV